MQDDLKDAMTWLGAHGAIFLGQGVGCMGTRMSKSFADVPPDLRLEFPVAEELQLGVSLGLSLEGFVPVSVFPRWNFLLCAANQLVNHLDRLPLYSDYRPKVIIRTAVGSNMPLDPGPQHQDDLSYAFGFMLRTVNVVQLNPDVPALSAYQEAFAAPGSTIVVEPC